LKKEEEGVQYFPAPSSMIQCRFKEKKEFNIHKYPTTSSIMLKHSKKILRQEGFK